MSLRDFFLEFQILLAFHGSSDGPLSTEVMSSTSESDSDGKMSDIKAVLRRYRLAEFPTALKQSYIYKRATQEISDLWRCLTAIRDAKIKKALQDALFEETVGAMSACDG